MEKRTVGIIATVATILLCACPGLFICIWGALGIAQVPITTTSGDVSQTAPMPTTVGIALICLAIILVLIPVAVGFFTLRNTRSSAQVPPPPPGPGEPLPPAI